jgi:hypothetical protein
MVIRNMGKVEIFIVTETEKYYAKNNAAELEI